MYYSEILNCNLDDNIWLKLILGLLLFFSQLFNWALEPAEDVILDELFDLGFQDAQAWVRKQEAPKHNLNGGTNGASSAPGWDI